MRRLRRLLHVLAGGVALLLSICIPLATMSLAQTPTAVVTGTVLDPTGAAVPDATVTAVNLATNVSSEKKTAADGTFTILNLLPGEYILSVAKEGFKKTA